MMKSFLLAPVLVASAGLALRAQTTRDTARMSPVVTSATASPVDLGSIPASVTVINGDDLRARGITSVADALRDVPGVAIAQTGSFGGTTSLFLRGGQSNYTKVVIDGVPVNAPGGGFDFASLTTDNIERIEIVQGPASVVWGSDAVTGVIQIITRSGSPGHQLAVSARGGSYGTVDGDATVFGGSGGSSYAFGLARHVTNGIYAFNNRYDNTVLSGRTSFRPDSSTDVGLSLRYTDFRAHYPTDYTGVPVDSVAYNTATGLALGLEGTRTINARLSLRLSLTASETDGGTDDAIDSASGGSSYESLDHVVRHGADLRAIARLTTSTLLTVGAEDEEEGERTQSQFGGSFPSTSIFLADRHNDAGYAELLTVEHGATITLGGRVDDNQAFGTFGTYRAAGLYRFATGTRVRASVGTAFREPSFFENYSTGFVRGNPSLQPEHTDSWEVALGQSLLSNRLVGEVVYFDQRFHNLIDYNGSAVPPQPSYFNVAQAKAAGEELTVKALLPADLFADGSLTHLDTKVLDRGFSAAPTALLVTGQHLLRRPEWSSTLGLGYRMTGRGSVELQVNSVGKRTDLLYTYGAPYTALDTLPAYTTVDLSGEIPLAREHVGMPSVALTLRAANLFDAKYQSVAAFLAPGRTLLAGAKLEF